MYCLQVTCTYQKVIIEIKRNLVAYRSEGGSQVLLVFFAEFAGTDEPLRHSFKVLASDGAILVEVNSLEVRSHLAEPEVGHLC